MDGYFYNFTSWIVNSVQKNATDICREVNNTAHHGDKVAAIIAPEKSAKYVEFEASTASTTFF